MTLLHFAWLVTSFRMSELSRIQSHDDANICRPQATGLAVFLAESSPSASQQQLAIAYPAGDAGKE